MFNNIFRKKAIISSRYHLNKNNLKKGMSGLQLIVLGLSGIIGGGIFVFTGKAAFLHAGPAVIISFILGGIICICAGLCYSEFASLIPICGGSYSYIYATLGELPAWITGVLIICSYFFSTISVSHGWHVCFIGLLKDFSIITPSELIKIPINNIPVIVTEYVHNLPAISICLASMLILYTGLSSSNTINTITVSVKILVLFIFIVIGCFFIKVDNWLPFIPENTGVFGEYGVSGVFAATSILFLSYNGFDIVCAAAQETKKPQKDIPIGIIGSIVIAMFTYILIGAVLTGIIHYKDLNTVEPISKAAIVLKQPLLLLLVRVGSLLAITSVIITHQYAIIRIIYSMSIDGIIPKIFSKTHTQFKTPYVTTLFVGILMAILIPILQIDSIIKLSTFFILITISTVCASLIYLRITMPDIIRPFKCPIFPIPPLVALLSSLMILTTYSYKIVCYTIGYIFCALLIYFIHTKQSNYLKE